MENSGQLPTAGQLNHRAREKSDLDFKRFVDRARPWEHAKDIAAFANALGGVILVGADDASGNLVYCGVQGQTVSDVRAIYEQAAQLCSPQPAVDVVPIVQGHVELVAVNCEPYLDELVAAPAGSRDRNGSELKHPNAWVFPIRRASQTDFIRPENLGAYMDRTVRRAVVLLEGIFLAARANVVLIYVQANAQAPSFSTGQLLEIAAERNFARFLVQLGGHAHKVHIPLRDVEDVWEHANNCWTIRIAGGFRIDGVGALTYVPPLHTRL